VQLHSFRMLDGLKTSQSEQLLHCTDPVTVSRREMRGVKSVVLHKDVIDDYRQKQRSDAHKDPESSLSQLASHRLANHVDMPLADLENPYSKPAPRCILCEKDVELDYKNVRLLSQFVSPHTGQIYGRSVTGLCLFMQKRIAKLIKRSQYFGFMPYKLKDPRFLRDPKLFDPFRRK